MGDKLGQAIRWFADLWRHADDAAVRDYRRHVRGLFVGWLLTLAAIVLVERFPNPARLDMYAMLRAPGLPWQQHWLAAIELAAPLVMFRHLVGLQRWGSRRTARN